MFHLIEDVEGKSKSLSSSSDEFLKVMNAVALSSNTELTPHFLDVAVNGYKSKIFFVDFANNQDASLNEINEWAHKQSDGKVTKLADHALPKDTSLVMMSAVLFHSLWDEPFYEMNTFPASFLTPQPDGSFLAQQVQMMHSIREVPYTRVSQGSLIELKFHAGKYSLILYLPDRAVNDLAGKETVESLLGATEWENSLKGMKTSRVSLSLPRMSIETSLSLSKVFSAMELVDVFSNQCDFSKISSNTKLVLNDLIQRTFFELNELGATAESHSAAVLKAKVEDPTGAIAFDVNRPFYFNIRINGYGLSVLSGYIRRAVD